jgi:hypothetical protein
LQLYLEIKLVTEKRKKRGYGVMQGLIYGHVGPAWRLTGQKTPGIIHLFPEIFFNNGILIVGLYGLPKTGYFISPVVVKARKQKNRNKKVRKMRFIIMGIAGILMFGAVSCSGLDTDSSKNETGKPVLYHIVDPYKFQSFV